MVGKLLLCSGRRGFMDARVISVVNQIKDGDNPISLILVETLLRESFDFTDMADGVTGHDYQAYNW